MLWRGLAVGQCRGEQSTWVERQHTCTYFYLIIPSFLPSFIPCLAETKTAEFCLCHESWWLNLEEFSWPLCPVMHLHPLTTRLRPRSLRLAFCRWKKTVQTDPPTPTPRQIQSDCCSHYLSLTNGGFQSSATVSSLTTRWGFYPELCGQKSVHWRFEYSRLKSFNIWS